MRLNNCRMRSVGSVLNALGQSPATADLRKECATRPQAFFQKAVDATIWRRLAVSETRPLHRERLEGVQRPHAGSWLSCFPNAGLGLKHSSDEFRAAARYWLGLSSDGWDPNRALLHSGQYQVARHDAIRDILYYAGRTASMRPHREVHVDGSNHKPGDIYFPNWSNGKSLAVDVTVSHPSQGNPSMLASAEDNASLR